jgi:hypothetical protein
MACSMRARINLAPTQQVKQGIVRADFTPAQSGCKYLEIAQFRLIFLLPHRVYPLARLLKKAL